MVVVYYFMPLCLRVSWPVIRQFSEVICSSPASSSRTMLQVTCPQMSVSVGDGEKGNR